MAAKASHDPGVPQGLCGTVDPPWEPRYELVDGDNEGAAVEHRSKLKPAAWGLSGQETVEYAEDGAAGVRLPSNSEQ